jgi:molybdenum-dependent DNA-binding transcriptional regulator ModE
MSTAIPDWHLFRTFLTVVREGSLSSAARALGTTQPTMGRQVAALEASLGVKLFTRSLDGLSPTEAGLRLIPSAEAMAAAVEAAQRSAFGEVDEEQGTVRVTASDVIGGEVLPSILASFRAVGSSTATLESELSDTTTSAQRAIIGTLANLRTGAFSRTWRHWFEIFSPTYLDRGLQTKKATIRIRRDTHTLNRPQVRKNQNQPMRTVYRNWSRQ